MRINAVQTLFFREDYRNSPKKYNSSFRDNFSYHNSSSYKLKEHRVMLFGFVCGALTSLFIIFNSGLKNLSGWSSSLKFITICSTGALGATIADKLMVKKI